MKKRRFLISSLLMAGIAPVRPLDASTAPGLAPSSAGPDPDNDAIIQRFAQQHRYLLAAHRSHSSHASHGSHRSGSSGIPRSPVYTPSPSPAPRTSPAPSSRNERSTPRDSVLPSSSATAPNSLYSAPTTDQISQVVRRVQLGLKSYGYYNGAIDGVVGKETRASLVRLQTDFGLKVTGTITPEVLDVFKIAAQ